MLMKYLSSMYKHSGHPWYGCRSTGYRVGNNNTVKCQEEPITRKNALDSMMFHEWLKCLNCGPCQPIVRSGRSEICG
jgi:hypothetical protein